MKAVILKNAKELTYEDVPTPKPGPGEVLLQVFAVSICGSDIKRVIEGHRIMPIILGHECSGVITEVGEGVNSSLIGTRAAVIPLIPCFKCQNCLQGLFSACKYYSFIGSRIDGCFSDFVIVPVNNLFPIGEDAKFEDAALIEPLTVIIHGLQRINHVSSKNVAIIGVGSLGALAIKWLKSLGMKNIIASDIDLFKLEYAKSLGADYIINPEQKDIIKEVMKITDGGVELILELAGTPQAIKNSISIAKPRAKILLFGNLPKGSMVSGDLFEQILRKELSIYGNWMSYSMDFPGNEWEILISALQSGTLNLTDVISHRYPLSETPGVFEKIINKSLAYRKIMLFPNEIFRNL